MHKPWIRKVVIAVLSILIVAGIGYGVYILVLAPTGTLTVWTPQGDQQALADAAKIYRSTGGRYNVKIVPVTENDYEMQSLFAIASNKAPDVWIIPNDWMDQHRDKLTPAPNGAIGAGLARYRPKPAASATASPTPAPDNKRSNTAIMTDDYPPIVANDTVSNGKVWGVPLDLDSLALFYDKTKINIPPKTWDDVTGTVDRFTQASGNTVARSALAIGTQDTTTIHATDIFTNLLLQYGVKMVDTSANIASFNLGAGTAGLSPGAKALSLYTSFSTPGNASYTWSGSMGSSLAAFEQGKTLMTVGYASDVPAVAKAAGNRLGVAPLPQINSDQPVVYGQYLTAAVPRNAPNAAEAWKFVSLFANPAVAAQYAKDVSLPPARKDLATTVDLGANYSAFASQNADVNDWQMKETGVAQSAIGDALKLAVADRKPVQDALDYAAKEYTTFLQSDTGINTDPSTLVIWQPEANSLYDYKEAIQEFKSSHSNIKRVIVSNRPDARFEWELLNAVAAGEGPDIAMVPNSSVARYHTFLNAEANNAFDTTNGTYKGLSSYERLFAPAVSTDAIVNGKIYGAPLSLESLAIIYNADLLSSVTQLRGQQNNQLYLKNSDLFASGPTTWDDLKTMAQVLTNKPGNTIKGSAVALGSVDNISHAADIFAAMVKEYGGEMTAPDEKSASFQLPTSTSDLTPAGQKALQLYQSFADPKQPYYSWNSSRPDDLTDLADGNLIMAFGYPRDIPTIKAKNPNIKLGLFFLPQLSTTSQPVDFASYYTATIPLSAKNRVTSLDFIRQTIFSSSIADDQLIKPFTSSKIPPVTQRNSAAGNVEATQALDAQSWFKGQYPTDADMVINQLIGSQLSLQQAADRINSLLSQSIL